MHMSPLCMNTGMCKKQRRGRDKLAVLYHLPIMLDIGPLKRHRLFGNEGGGGSGKSCCKIFECEGWSRQKSPNF